MDLSAFKKAIEESWGKDTCYPKFLEQWSPNNPALGQCVVTSLVVQDYLGGDLLYCKHMDHFWNKTNQAGEIDFTKDQFPNDAKICLDEIRSRDQVMNSPSSIKARTSERYRFLKQRVEMRLS